MAIERIRIDYTVYSPGHQPEVGTCWDLRNLCKAKRKARGLGMGSSIYRNFNQTNKKDRALGDWWTGKWVWTWNGSSFEKRRFVPRRQVDLSFEKA